MLDGGLIVSDCTVWNVSSTIRLNVGGTRSLSSKPYSKSSSTFTLTNIATATLLLLQLLHFNYSSTSSTKAGCLYS